MAAEILHATDGIEDASAFVALDAGNGRPLRLERTAAGGYDNGLAGDCRAGIGRDAEAVFNAFERSHHLAEMEFWVERTDLLKDLVDEPLRCNHRRGRNVVDRLLRIKLRALPAGSVEDVDEGALHVEQTELEHREEPDRACADDDDVGFFVACGHRNVAPALFDRPAHAWLAGTVTTRPSSSSLTVIWQDSLEFGRSS